jgi:hypothetical protein
MSIRGRKFGSVAVYAGIVSGGGSISLGLTDSDMTTFNNVVSTSNTYTGKSFGAAAASRQIIVAIGWRSSSGVASPGPACSGVTIGGVTASLVVASAQGTASSDFGAEIWAASVPTGTTGNIVVNYTTAPGNGVSGQGRLVISVYSLILSTGSPVTASGGVASAPGPVGGGTLTIPAGGVCLGVVCAASGASAIAVTPSGMSVDISQPSVGGSGTGYGSAHSAPGVLTGSTTVSFTDTLTGGGGAFALAAWSP